MLGGALPAPGVFSALRPQPSLGKSYIINHGCDRKGCVHRPSAHLQALTFIFHERIPQKHSFTAKMRNNSHSVHRAHRGGAWPRASLSIPVGVVSSQTPQPWAESPCPGPGSCPSCVWGRHESSLVAQASSVKAGAGGPAHWRCPPRGCPWHPVRAHPHCASLKPQTHNFPPPREVAQGLGAVCWCTRSWRGGGCFRAPLLSRSVPNISTQTPAATRRRLSAQVWLLHGPLGGACLLVPSCLSLFINLK